MRRLALSLALAALAAAAVPAAAQNYPTRPVRMILPFGAGGVADITARVVAERLGEKIGQRFVIENMPGAGGIAAARAVLSAPADGYTLALLSNGTAVSAGLFKNLPFDPMKDFLPISSLGYFDFVVATSADSQFKTMADVVKYAKDNPGKLNVGTINVGSTQNLSAELLKSAAGIQFQIIPYRGTPEVLIAALRNDANIMIDNYSGMKANLADGKLRALASTGEAKSIVLKDVPTVQEAGVKGYDVVSWNALFAPKGTPNEVIDRLNAALKEVLATADVKARLLELGIEAKASTPQEIQDRLKSDIDKWSKVIQAAGIAKQ
ncbi:tripartite tricarboxylate transporter substrate binding protein [Xanthobacteraceae bacterium Astr-EGSB]|uniref:Bug family tripartite tricarboxylate transporter substrate binding protein n=1 Tax=Astrobacterium formosum TaxID=3069710 RepID=UPI0027B61F09|nr:tripartite tricarboxylate transporter substrate binding protein [Xanthobacteraceae bacterium Astr-EGSB]